MGGSTPDCASAAQRRDSPRRRRRRPCWLAAVVVLFASFQITQSQPPRAFPGQSFNLTAKSFGFRAVSLGWIQLDNTSFGEGAHHLAKYVIYNGDQVILDDPNVTSVATTSPCGAHNCSALQLVAEVGNLAVGQYYGFVVKSVYSYVQGGDTVEGEPSGTVQMLVTDPPSPPRDIAATALVGGMKLSWKPPANTGMGNIWSVFYSNSSGVLRGYKLLVSTLSTYDPAGCAGGQSQSCYSRVLPSWAAEASINGLQGGVAYNAWLLAYNVLFEGDSASLMSFTVRQVATAPQNAILSLKTIWSCSCVGSSQIQQAPKPE